MEGTGETWASAACAPVPLDWILFLFTPLATNLPGQPGTTTYTDTNAAGAGPFLYRVGVRD